MTLELETAAKETARQFCLKVAENLLDKFTIGTYMYGEFDWDGATREEIAQVIMDTKLC